MTITELKEIYNKATTDNAKLKYDFPFDEYVKIESYIPIAAKIDIAQKAAAEVYEEYDGIRSYDKVSSDIIRDLTVVSLYTNIEYTEDETFEAYDELTKMGFFNYLLDMDDYMDIYRFRQIYDDILHQIVDEHNSLPNVVNRGLLRLEDKLVTAINNFADKANVNPEEIEKLKESLLNINSTMDRVKDVSSKEIVEAYKE